DISIGADNGSSAEFDSVAPFEPVFFPATMPTSSFPYELNRSTWATQRIAFALDSATAARGLLLTLDVATSQLSGTLTARVEIANQAGTFNAGLVALRPSAKAYVSIPASNLWVGLNTLILRSTSGVQYVRWDQIRIEPDRYTLRLAYSGTPFTIYGMWLNDPKVSGLGYNVFVSASELTNVYAASEAAGEWWFIVDPPRDRAAFETAVARVDAMTMELAAPVAAPSVVESLRGARARQSASGRSRSEPGGGDPLPDLRDAIPYALLNDGAFLATFEQALFRQSYIVNEGRADAYGLVAGGLRGKGTTVYVLQMDAGGGYLRQATWDAAARPYPPVPLNAAIWLARRALNRPDAALLSAGLAYSPDRDPSPFLPCWSLTFDVDGTTQSVDVPQTADASGDADSDGVSDLEELYAGTDPDNPASFFAVEFSQSAAADGALRITWPSTDGSTYSIYRAEDLLQGFNILRSGIPASPPSNTYVDSPPAPSGAYRIEAE
ncbi:MAG: hypothetical protein BWK77_01550, partial [Verrucomicrobia bacterium A1]